MEREEWELERERDSDKSHSSYWDKGQKMEQGDKSHLVCTSHALDYMHTHRVQAVILRVDIWI